MREGFTKLIGRYALTALTSGVTRVNADFYLRWISATDPGTSD